MRARRHSRLNGARRRTEAFTLVEAMVAMLILGLGVAGVVYGFVQIDRSTQWSSYSLAAQSLAMQPVEQARGAKWDPNGWPPVDELVSSNFPLTVLILDVPVVGTNIVYATNRTSIRTVSTSPPVKEIQVVCTWAFQRKRVYTNTLITYRALGQ